MSSFASGKFALRATGQSLAREFGPKGVHVAHAIIDGVIDIPRTRDWPVNGGVEDGKISSDAVSLLLPYSLIRGRGAPDRVKVELKLTLLSIDCRFLLVLAHSTTISLYPRTRCSPVYRKVLGR
jgi:hypothetical protein